AYVDTHLIGSGKVSRAAIIGRQGGVWASSAGFDLSAQEQTEIIQALANKESVQSKGIRAAGVKYFYTDATERSIYGKKGPDGIVLVQTSQAILVAIYLAPIQGPEAINVVEKLADYLISVNY
ncbi:profilin, partial [Cantharellus anzutake]|uniref:profilin n=1 Tax=Cantharellus anzutake TaxID=1750568 RepID=UPI00190522AC